MTKDADGDQVKSGFWDWFNGLHVTTGILIGLGIALVWALFCIWLGLP